MQEVGCVGLASQSRGAVVAEDVLAGAGEVWPVLQNHHQHSRGGNAAVLCEPVQHVDGKLLVEVILGAIPEKTKQEQLFKEGIREKKKKLFIEVILGGIPENTKLFIEVILGAICEKQNKIFIEVILGAISEKKNLHRNHSWCYP